MRSAFLVKMFRLFAPWRRFRRFSFTRTKAGLTLPSLEKTLHRGTFLGVTSISLVAFGYFYHNRRRFSRWKNGTYLPEVYAKTSDVPVVVGRKQRRFRQFASCEYNGQLYMTPQDFLESISFNEPEARIGLRQLNEMEVAKFLKKVPPIAKSSSKFFRNVWKDGLLSYPEYLFLTTLLTKPKRQFEIAFLMFDQDSSGKIDRNEFLSVQLVLNKQRGNGKDKSFANTTLLVHLFGLDGKQLLNFDAFSRFMDNLQTEVLDIEFHEVSRGLPVISEVEFARLLLRDSSLDESETQEYIRRVNARMQRGEGITFLQFLEFARFLNELENFSVAVRMFTLAGQPITQDEFQRAVKSSIGGAGLDPHLVEVVFQIFDVDGDGKLGYDEFIDVMKDRRNRGFKSRDVPKGWEGFKHCMGQKMK
eukprot:m.309111 g.309111  ORF g.309111 m.309111 type:complete len:418 (+) comp45522_c0_seq1:2-1255(+)